MLIRNIQPTTAEVSDLEACRKHLVQYLAPRVDTARFLLMGSHTRGTAIAGSDMDVLQVIRKKEVTWGGSLVSSNTVLSNIRSTLAGYGRTDVRRDQVALVVSYKSGVHIDLVPGYYSGPGVGNYPVYHIPDGRGGWLSASPEAHNAYIKAADERAGGKLKRTVQIIKYWRRCRVNEIPLNSFHLEIALASSKVCEGLKSYSQCVLDAFSELTSREARAIRDPVGVAGLISASATDTMKASVANSLANSTEHARNARRAELQGMPLEAARQWSTVFNGGFA